MKLSHFQRYFAFRIISIFQYLLILGFSTELLFAEIDESKVRIAIFKFKNAFDSKTTQDKRSDSMQDYERLFPLVLKTRLNSVPQLGVEYIDEYEQLYSKTSDYNYFISGSYFVDELRNIFSINIVVKDSINKKIIKSENLITNPTNLFRDFDTFAEDFTIKILNALPKGYKVAMTYFEDIIPETNRNNFSESTKMLIKRIRIGYFSEAITKSLNSNQSINVEILPTNDADKRSDSKRTPRKIGDSLGADFIIGGNLFLEGDKIFASAFLMELETGLSLPTLKKELDNKLYHEDYLIKEINELVKVTLSEKGEWDEIKRVLSSGQKDTMMAKVERLVEDNRYDLALVIFLFAIDKFNIASADIYYNLGIIYQYKENPELENALTEFDEALKLSPDNTFYEKAKAEVLIELDKPDVAIEFIQSVLKRETNSNNLADFYMLLGDAFFQKENFYSSIDAYKNAIQNNSSLEQAYISLAAVYRYLLKYNDAIDIYEQLIKINPNEERTYLNLAQTYRANFLSKEAAAVLESARQLFPDSKSILNYLVEIYYDLGDTKVILGEYDAALDYFQKALNIDPGYAIARAQIAFVAHEYLFQFQRAYEEDQILIKSDSSSISYKANFTENNLTVNRNEEAYKLAKDLISKSQVDQYYELNMRYVALAASVLLKNNNQASSELKDFINFYKTLNEDFTTEWSYNGSRHYFKNITTIEADTKLFLISLIDLLQEKISIESFEASVPAYLKN